MMIVSNNNNKPPRARVNFARRLEHIALFNVKNNFLKSMKMMELLLKIIHTHKQASNVWTAHENHRISLFSHCHLKKFAAI